MRMRVGIIVFGNGAVIDSPVGKVVREPEVAIVLTDDVPKVREKQRKSLAGGTSGPRRKT
jgi:hypothetical protein